MPAHRIRFTAHGLQGWFQAFGVPRGAAILFLCVAIPTGRFRHAELSCELADEFPWFAASALYPVGARVSRFKASLILQRPRFSGKSHPPKLPHAPARCSFPGNLPVWVRSYPSNDERHSWRVALALDFRGHWPPPVVTSGGCSAVLFLAPRLACYSLFGGGSSPGALFFG